MRFVDLEEARSAAGPRLVVVGKTTSPWSEAAKGLFTVKELDVLLVRAVSPDEAVKQWTGSHNAPVLVLEREPPRTHWSEILEATERLGGKVSLVPTDPDERICFFGLGHEILGENGLAWNVRNVAVHRGLTTEGKSGFGIRAAKYLSHKYGYAADRADAALARVIALFKRFAAMIEASENGYLLGDKLTALDIYLAATFNIIVPLTEAECPGMHPALRQAFKTGDPEMIAAVPAVLREHRDRMYKEHLGLPVEV